jgi:hypothetical protein
MLKKLLIAFGIVLIVSIAYVAYTFTTTKSHSPSDQAMYEGTDLKVTVDYCRPYKKGRIIFGTEAEGALQPYGVKWRTGANEATEIEFSTDVMISGKVLQKGRYSMYSIPEEDRFTIVFNENLAYWGAGLFEDPFDESKDVLRVEVPVLTTIESTEQFQISFEEIMNNNSVMVLKWDKTQINVPISKL